MPTEIPPPPLGVGLIYMPGLEPLLEPGHDLVQVVEVEPQMFWLFNPAAEPHFRVDRQVIERLRRSPATKLVHGVGFPVGGSRSPGAEHLATFLEAIEDLRSPWASEHLSFNQATSPEGMFNTGFLLPPLQTRAGAAAAAATIRSFAANLPVPFAVETGVNYLRPRAGELGDGAFVRQVVEAADCGILLDLHNLWANERNGRQPVLDFLNEIPRERVWEIHLAGGLEHGGYWLDAHSGAIPEPLLSLAAEIVPTLPNLGAIIFEILSPFVPRLGLDGVLEQLEQLHRLWQLRGTAPVDARGSTSRPVTVEAAAASVEPERWEQALGATVLGRAGDRPLERDLRQDPGTELLKELIQEFRAGMVVDTLKLTCRLLFLHGGPPLVRQLLAEFWATTPPSLFASQEAEAFAAFLRQRRLEVPYLDDVLGFEVAVVQAVTTAEPRTVRFRAEPAPLLEALGESRLPPELPLGDYEVEVAAPA